MSRSAWTGRASCALLAAKLSACAGGGAEVELVVPADANEVLSALLVTAIEPIADDPNDPSRHVLVKCGQVGVFPPTAIYNREGSDVTGIAYTLMSRERTSFPLDGGWSLEVPPPKSAAEFNPWRAVLVHFEGIGFGSAYSDGLPDPTERTLLEGCFCMRLDEAATHPDDALDAAVKAACPALETLSGAPVEVDLQAIAPSPFKLKPCGVPQVTASANQTLVASPGFCVDAVPCSPSSPTPNCFQCRADTSCPELVNKRNLPIKVELIDAPADARPRANRDVVLTNAAGVAVPEFDIASCSQPFRIRASIVGRPSEFAELSVDCVGSVRFEPAAEVRLGEVAVVGFTVLPGKSGGDSERLVVLSEVDQLGNTNTQIEVFEYAADQGVLRMVGSTQIQGERPRGVLGYHHQVSPTPGLPLLAVVTSQRILGEEKPLLRIYDYDADAEALVQLAKKTGDCPYSACGQVGGRCEAAATCSLRAESEGVARIATKDLNRDGFADLAISLEKATEVQIFYSQARRTGPGGVLGLPNDAGLEESCECVGTGKVLDTFTLAELGGAREPEGLHGVDLVIGDTTGAFIRYAETSVLAGTPCSTDEGCPVAQVCQEHCAGHGRGICGEVCEASAPMCGEPLVRPTCTATSAGPRGLCAPKTLRCGAGFTFPPMRLVGVHDLVVGSFGGGAYDDVVIVGAGSPVPGRDGVQQISVMFGTSEYDLTQLESLPKETQERASIELKPSVLPGRAPAQGPRAAAVGRFNGDDADDVAVLYAGTEEVRVWLGTAAAAPGEYAETLALSACGASCPTSQRCAPKEEVVTGDLDGNGLDEVIAACAPQDDLGVPVRPRILWFRASGGSR